MVKRGNWSILYWSLNACCWSILEKHFIPNTCCFDLDANKVHLPFKEILQTVQKSYGYLFLQINCTKTPHIVKLINTIFLPS
jgi:hypothetical protein